MHIRVSTRFCFPTFLSSFFLLKFQTWEAAFRLSCIRFLQSLRYLNSCCAFCSVDTTRIVRSLSYFCTLYYSVVDDSRIYSFIAPIYIFLFDWAIYFMHQLFSSIFQRIGGYHIVFNFRVYMNIECLLMVFTSPLPCEKVWMGWVRMIVAFLVFLLCVIFNFEFQF